MKLNKSFSIASAIASATLIGTLAPAANAVSLVPQEQGEINVGLGCLDSCLELDPIIESIVSLNDSSSGSVSRLFVDYFGEDDVEVTYGDGDVVFLTQDAGTNAEGFWFRPSEYDVETGEAEEDGQLEVGTYLITFSDVIEGLTVDYFDTESWDTTGVLAVNGEAVDSGNYLLDGGADGNIISKTYYNVESIVLTLGNDKLDGTGDGVNFRLADAGPASVPEPSSLLGLMAAAGGSLLLKKKQQASVFA